MSTLLKIEPNDGTSWYAEVLSNLHGDGRFWATADQYWCCALFASSVYWFDVRDPRSVVGNSANHLSGETVLFAPSHDLLLICDDPIIAYGRGGLRWVTGRLAFDRILDVVLDGDIVRGIADTYPDGTVPFTVDLATGEHSGGFDWGAI